MHDVEEFQPFVIYTLLTTHEEHTGRISAKKNSPCKKLKSEGDILPVGSQASLVNKRCITRLKMFRKQFPIITDWGKAHNSDRQPTRRIITSGVRQTIEKGSFMFKERFLRNLSHTTTKQFQKIIWDSAQSKMHQSPYFSLLALRFTNSINFFPCSHDSMIDELAVKDKEIQEYLQR